MGERLWRLRRWLYGSPQFDVTPAPREALREFRALTDELRDEAEEIPYPLPNFPNAVRLRYPAGVAEELEFRRYARRSGQVVA